MANSSLLTFVKKKVSSPFILSVNGIYLLGIKLRRDVYCGKTKIVINKHAACGVDPVGQLSKDVYFQRYSTLCGIQSIK